MSGLPEKKIYDLINFVINNLMIYGMYMYMHTIFKETLNPPSIIMICQVATHVYKFIEH